MAVKTKIELEREIKDLKSQVRELRIDVKSDKEAIGDLNSTAIGVVFDGTSFTSVKIKFDIDKKSAIIVGTEKLGGSKMMASSHLKKSIIDQLVKLT